MVSMILARITDWGHPESASPTMYLGWAWDCEPTRAAILGLPNAVAL